jgi:hypothetical protein
MLGFWCSVGIPAGCSSPVNLWTDEAAWSPRRVLQSRGSGMVKVVARALQRVRAAHTYSVALLSLQWPCSASMVLQ